jgi:hypothetical protein
MSVIKLNIKPTSPDLVLRAFVNQTPKGLDMV